MKKIILLFIICLLLCSTLLHSYGQTVYSSPNPKTDPWVTKDNMLKLYLGDLFTLSGGLSGGIVGNASGGRVTISAYYYDQSVPDGKGGLLYRCYTDQNSSNYVEKSITFTKEHWTWLIITFYPWEESWASTDIKKMAMKAGVLHERSYGCWGSVCAPPSGMFDKIPVIVEATIEGSATFSKFKVPAVGEFEASLLKPVNGARNFSKVNQDVAIACHRGYWEDVTAPENTYNAIGQAITRNYDIIELDMWTTSDNTVIVFHDMGLNKRTTQTGAVQSKTWSQISGLYIKNRFDEVISTSNTKMVRLEDVLNYIKTNHPTSKIWLNLDRSANDMVDFKRVYQVVKNAGLLGQAIFKGRYNAAPATGEKPPTVANIKQAFQEMFPSMTQTERDNEMKLMFFTPVLFDNTGVNISGVKTYIDDMVNAGLADGFELTFKAKPAGSGDYSIDDNNKIFILRQWAELGNKTFVQYVKDKGLPVGIFASVPEVGAIPNFNTNGTRNPNDLVSGFIKEDLNNNYNPKVQDQSTYDFRGDWDFYIPGGADYVITDRPDALLDYLKAIGKHN